MTFCRWQLVVSLLGEEGRNCSSGSQHYTVDVHSLFFISSICEVLKSSSIISSDLSNLHRATTEIDIPVLVKQSTVKCADVLTFSFFVMESTVHLEIKWDLKNLLSLSAGVVKTGCSHIHSYQLPFYKQCHGMLNSPEEKTLFCFGKHLMLPSSADVSL